MCYDAVWNERKSLRAPHYREDGVHAVEQEKGNFRGRVFGGFDRQDVIDYIESLATERNALSRENQQLQERLWELEEQAAAPAEEPAGDSERREIAGALEEARELLRTVKREYDALCADVKINATQAEGELKTISARLSGLQAALGSAGEKLEEIGSRLETSEE